MSLEERLALAFLAAHPVDAARVLERLAPGAAVAALAGTPPAIAAGVLRRLTPPVAADCLEQLPADEGASIVAALPLDAAAIVLRRLSPAPAVAVLAALSPAQRSPLEAVLQHPEHTAGALMDPRILAVPDDVTVTDALARVRQGPEHVLYYVYVVDRDGRLVGVLNLRELMLAPADAALADVMRPATARLTTLDGVRAVVVHPAWRVLHAMPVVDGSGRFAGAIRYETVRRLERDLDRETPPAGADLGTLLGLAELCWVGMTGVLVSLGPRPGRGAPSSSGGDR